MIDLRHSGTNGFAKRPELPVLVTHFCRLRFDYSPCRLRTGSTEIDPFTDGLNLSLVDRLCRTRRGHGMTGNALEQIALIG